MRPERAHLTIGCSATDFPTLFGPKLAREPGVVACVISYINLERRVYFNVRSICFTNNCDSASYRF